jgi:hypothetical protein
MRLPEGSDIISELFSEWGAHLETLSQYEFAAKWYDIALPLADLHLTQLTLCPPQLLTIEASRLWTQRTQRSCTS